MPPPPRKIPFSQHRRGARVLEERGGGRKMKAKNDSLVHTIPLFSPSRLKSKRPSRSQIYKHSPIPHLGYGESATAFWGENNGKTKKQALLLSLPERREPALSACAQLAGRQVDIINLDKRTQLQAGTSTRDGFPLKPTTKPCSFQTSRRPPPPRACTAPPRRSLEPPHKIKANDYIENCEHATACL